VDVSEFAYFFAFMAILLGLAVAEMARRFADALGARERVRLGWLTPPLALFLLLDISSSFLWFWASRAPFTLSWMSVWVGLFVGITYFISAAMVFPRSLESVTSLDDHYRKNKRWVVGGILLINVLIYVVQFARATPIWSDGWFWFWQIIYWVPLLWLFLARSRALNLILLAILIGQYLAMSALPGSTWTNAIEIDSGAPAASTNAPPPPR
jgi:hypothetical protein